MFQKIFKKKSVPKKGSPKSRSLRLENLESRALLSVTTFEAETAVALETQTFAPAPNVETIDLAPLAQGASTETPSLVVTTVGDVVDATDGQISLREAIAYSEADATLGGVVTFASSLQGATLTLGGSQLEITQSVAIDASALWDATNDAPGLTIDANAASRVFNIIAGTADAPVSLTGLKITGGYVSGGGGGVYLKGVANFVDCVFVDNEATSQGGGAYAYGASTFDGCLFENNSAKYGGGLYLRNAATVENTAFVGNAASYYGGGSYAFNNGMTFANSVWVGNSAARQGGGMFGESATATNCTVAGNVSKVGGGFYLESASTLRNTIVSSNFATEGTPDFYGAFASGSGSNLIGFDAGFSVAPTFDADGVLTNASTVDLRLSATSWAIDRGANEYVATDLATDLDGNARIQAAWRSSATVDVGAYEYGATLTKTPETASAVVTTVADVVDDSDGLISLREAILYAEADASLGGVVAFDAALQGETLVLSGAQLDISKSVKIDATSLWDAENDAPGLTIDANAKSRIFGVSGGTEAAPVELVALSLINGFAADGGAVNASGVVAFENCSIKNNVSSERGGGVYAAAGFATFESCAFVGNVAASNGGGVYIYDDGATEISNCFFTENVATSNNGGGVCARGTETTILGSVFTNNSANSNYGGGAFAYWGETRIENSEFSGNSAKYGGGVSFSSATATLANCAITDNDVVYNGGGVYTSSGETTLTNCAISGNVAGSYGGGIAVSGPTTLENCAIVGNVATSKGGGGVYAYKATTIINGLIAENRTDASGGGVMLRGEATLVNATIAGNEAAVSGGGLYGYNSSASATLSNTIVVGNVATAVVDGADYNVYPNFSTLNAYNVLSTFSAWTNKTEKDVVHYIYNASQPLFKDAENGDYSLAENSQALDKGSDALAVDAQGAPLTLDLAGNPRFLATVDVGAYETPGAAPLAPTGLSAKFNAATQTATLSWTDNATDETGYQVERLGADGETWTLVARLDANATTWTTDALQPGETRRYRALAVNAQGAASSEAVDLTLDADSTTVTTLADVVDPLDGEISLREAIQYAETGATVAFDASLSGGTLALSGTEIKIAKTISIDGGTGVTIDANQASRAFYIASGTIASPVELIGLTIVGGKCDGYGGGVYISKAAILKNCVVSGNAANFGGGLYVARTGSATLVGGGVHDNAAKYGAALFV
ncbi:MAG: hypothetical protein IJZ10_09205, partial [Thermoguttaceae bacterium]|nr:hypothetical protein [Thermoguttaceae bacterium]